MVQEKAKARGFANKKAEAVADEAVGGFESNAAELLDKLDAKPAQIKCKVIHGANDGDFEVDAGTTVGTLRKNLRDKFNIPADAQAYLDGNEVNDEAIVQEGNTIELVKFSGVKGRLPIWQSA